MKNRVFYGNHYRVYCLCCFTLFLNSFAIGCNSKKVTYKEFSFGGVGQLVGLVQGLHTSRQIWSKVVGILLIIMRYEPGSE